MKFLSHQENRIRCGRCGTEFDLLKNSHGCPLCGFGLNTSAAERSITPTASSPPAPISEEDLLSTPPSLKLEAGKPQTDEETIRVGHWGMFNDFFSGKAVIRITANLMNRRGTASAPLSDVVSEAKKAFIARKLHTVRGFPSDINKESSIGRLINHFIAGYHRMGLLDASVEGSAKKGSIWANDFRKIQIRPTKEGLEFARLHNTVLDDRDLNPAHQVLTEEEAKWMISYLRSINDKGFKEFTTLKAVYDFLRGGKNGKDDLWDWFQHNPHFIAYVKFWSTKSEDAEAFRQQLSNLSKTFSASKVSLLRELRIITNERNNYKIIGGL